MKRRKKVRRIGVFESANTYGPRPPMLNYSQINVHADGHFCRTLMAHYSPATKVRLNVNPMRRHQIDEPLETLALATWISHGPNHRHKRR
jgi:hypothetical protein